MNEKLEKLSVAGTPGRLARDWKKYREYVFYAARAELRAETANSYLNWAWWVLEPFCMMLVYTVVFGVIFRSGEPYFAVFVMTGITLWRFFAMTVQNSASLVRNHRSIVCHIYIPKQMLLLILMFRNAFKAALAFLIVFVMMAVFRVPLHPTMFLLVPGVILLFCVTYFVSCIVMHLGVRIEDMNYVSNVVLTILMFFSGTFWSIENRLPAPWGLIVSRVNPVAYAISICRNGLLYGTNSLHWTYFIWLGGALLLSLIGSWLVYRHENTYVKVI